MGAFRSLAVAFAASLLPTVLGWNLELPTCSYPVRPFEYVGCFAESDPNTLAFRSSVSQYNMSQEDCFSICKGNGFRYAGLEYYGICFCGNAIQGPQVDDSQCTFGCSGNKSETCGGNNRLSIFQDTTYPDLDENDISDYESLGCYYDNSPQGRALSYPQSQYFGSNMTTEVCLAACKAGGYPYAGTEYASECWCGIVLGDGSYSTPSDCTMSCAGNKNETCGGPSRLSVYYASDMKSSEPCGSYNPGQPVASVSTVSTVSTIASAASTTDSTAATTGTVSTSTEPATFSTSAVTASTDAAPTPIDSSIISASATGASSSPTDVSVTSSSSSSTSLASSSTSSSISSSTSSSSTSSSSSTATATSSTTLLTTTSVASTSSSTTSTTSTTPSSTSVSSTSSTSTSRPATTTAPTTTSKAATSSTSSICYATSTIPSTCEYKCGNWCNNNLPDFNDQTSCQAAVSNCELQLASCFINAGWPGAMDCFSYSSWCLSIGSYCSSKSSGLSKSDCYSKYTPVGNPATTTKIAVPCTAAATSTKKTTTTSATPNSTQCPIPSVTNICKQPTDRSVGYAPGNPVGGIDLPVVTCNDLKSDWSRNPFKLYTQSDSSKCNSYSRYQVPSACSDACQAQYNQCLNVYAQSCKQQSSSSASFWDLFFGQFGRHRRSLSALDRRTSSWSDTYSGATKKCKTQYNDCLSENMFTYGSGKCGSWGSGW